MIHATLKNLPTEDICIHLSVDNHALQYLCECGSASLLSKKDCLSLGAVFISHTQIMRKAGVKKAIPVHFSRRYDETEIAIIHEEFKAGLL